MEFRRAAHVAWRKIGDETVLIHLKNKQVYVLNESGGFFWHQLDGTRGMDEILSDVGLTDTVDAVGHLETFGKRLQEADLVDRDSGEPGPEPARRVPEYPYPGFVPPELLWQQELRNFGQSCAFVGGANAACDAVPTT